MTKCRGCVMKSVGVRYEICRGCVMKSNMQIYIADLGESTPGCDFDEPHPSLIQQKQRGSRGLAKDESVQRNSLTRFMLKKIVYKYLGITITEADIALNDYGKPDLIGRDDFHFNISHSGRWIVIAVDHTPLGVDIERIQPVDYMVAKKFFSDVEYADLMDKHGSERLRYFYDLWTLKESYIKAIGRGLSIPLDSFTIRINNRREISIKTCNNTVKCNSEWFFKQYDFDKNYRLSLCATHNDFPDLPICIYLDRAFALQYL